MIINLSINEILTAAGTPPVICGSAGVAAGLSGLAVGITDNYNNPIFTVADMAACTYLTPGTAQVSAVTDNFNNSAITSAYYDGGTGKFIIDIALEEVYNNVWLKFNITKAGMNPYTNIIKVYGYDLGTSNNTNLNNHFTITLTREYYTSGGSNYELPYSDFIYIRKPLTNIVECYLSVSTICAYISYNNVVGTNYYYTSDIEQTVSLHVGNLYYSCVVDIDIAGCISWMPTQTTTMECINNCNDECHTVFESSVVNVAVVGSSENFVYCDGALKSAYEHLGIRFELVRNDGAVIYRTGRVLNYNNTEWAANSYSHLQSWNIPVALSNGLHVGRTYLEIVGEYSNKISNQELFIDASTLVIRDNLIGTPMTNLLNVASSVLRGNAGIVGDADQSKLSLLLFESTITPHVYYKVRTNQDSWNFIDTGGLYLEPTLSAVDDYFYYDERGVIINWGSLSFGGTTFAGFSVSEVYAIYTCYNSVDLTVCDWMELSKTGCNTITIVNRSNAPILVNINKVETSTSLSLVGTYTTPALSTNSFTLADGSYVLEAVGYDEVVRTSVFHAYCGIIECIKAYTDKLICCNPDTNCAPCVDDNCNEKNYYDFNAFSMLAFNYLAGVNSFYAVDGTFDFTNPTVIAELFNLNRLMEYAKKYCLTCNEPCADCQ